MTRAMTLIRMYFVGSLRALSNDISRRLAEKVCLYTLSLPLSTSIPYNSNRTYQPLPNPTYYTPVSAV